MMFSMLLALSASQPVPETPLAAAATTWLACLEEKVPAVPQSLDPQAGADRVWQQCDVARAPFDRLIADQIARTPEKDQAENRARYDAKLAEGRQWVAAEIIKSRSAK